MAEASRRWLDPEQIPAAVRDERFFRAVLDALPIAVYMTDPRGRITYFNEAAALFWGCDPEVDKDDQWCGSWKLFWPDGRPMAGPFRIG